MAFDLTSIETALAKVQSGQSYRVDGFFYTRADLKTLFDICRELKAESAAENKTMFSLASFDKTS